MSPNRAYTRSPSVTGVAEAKEFFGWMLDSTGPSCAVRCQSTAPLSRSRQTTFQRWLPGCMPSTVVRPLSGRYRPGCGPS